jgi:hypothetical protein
VPPSSLRIAEAFLLTAPPREVDVNFELLNSLARTRQDDLLRAAAARRLLLLARRHRPRLRVRLGRALRAFGYFATTLAEALG